MEWPRTWETFALYRRLLHPSAIVRREILQTWPILLVRNTKTQLRRASKQIHLISIKFEWSLRPAHWSDPDKHYQWDSGWSRSECACLGMGWNKIIEDMIKKSAFTYKFKRKNRAQTLLCCEDCSWPHHWSRRSLPAFPRGIQVRGSIHWTVSDVWTEPLPSSSVWDKEHSSERGQTSTSSGNSGVRKGLFKWGSNEHCSGNRLLSARLGLFASSFALEQRRFVCYRIAESYAEFTLRNYGVATAVFDGYCTGASIKDNTHQRRGKIAFSH